MLRFKLRTFLIVSAVGPPALWGITMFLGPTVTCRYSDISATHHKATVISHAVDCYVIDIGEWPPNLKSLLVCPLHLADTSKWRGPYLDHRQLLLDPWENALQYELLSTHNGRIRIWSNGPDEISGTEDDIVAVTR
jgi:hypothetical protein